MLIKFFLDPCLALCHLMKDGSLNLIENIAAVCLPTVAVSKTRRDALTTAAEDGLPLRNTQQILEQRVDELEKKVTSLQMLLVKAKSRNAI